MYVRSLVMLRLRCIYTNSRAKCTRKYKFTWQIYAQIQIYASRFPQPDTQSKKFNFLEKRENDGEPERVGSPSISLSCCFSLFLYQFSLTVCKAVILPLEGWSHWPIKLEVLDTPKIMWFVFFNFRWTGSTCVKRRTTWPFQLCVRRRPSSDFSCSGTSHSLRTKVRHVTRTVICSLSGLFF